MNQEPNINGTENKYQDALFLATAVEGLIHSEFWGTNEGVMWEDCQETRAAVLFAILTGYQYHQEVKNILLAVVHLEASEYDGRPEKTKELAHQCLDALAVFESHHDEEYKLHDLATQVLRMLYEDAAGRIPTTVDEFEIRLAIQSGVNYQQLVKGPLQERKPQTPYEQAVLSDLTKRLEARESMHPKKPSLLSTVYGYQQSLKGQPSEQPKEKSGLEH